MQTLAHEKLAVTRVAAIAAAFAAPEDVGAKHAKNRCLQNAHAEATEKGKPFR